jgi:hypothetical protein
MFLSELFDSVSLATPRQIMFFINGGSGVEP